MKEKYTIISQLKSYYHHLIKSINENKFIFIAHVGYFLFFIHSIILMIKVGLSLYFLDYSIVTTSLWYFIPSLLLPPMLWIYATQFTCYNFHYIKTTTLSLILLNEGLLVCTQIYKFLSWVFIPSILDIPTNDVFTKQMSLVLCRVATQIPLLIFASIVFHALFTLLREKGGNKRIIAFKLSHFVRKQQNEIQYDMNIVKDIKTGHGVIIPMKERFLHTLVDGSSGTAKTSSTILPAIRDDLNMRCKAEDKQKNLLCKMFDKEQLSLSNKNQPFSVFNILPNQNADIDQGQVQKELDEIHTRYPICGITVLAPDDSLTDAVCNLCDSRQISYYRIDPIRLANGERKKNCIGMNPFYVPPNCTEEYKHELIVKKAILFSDVMQAITDLKGSADSYFTGINRQMISNIAILAMLTIPILEKRQATPEDLQEFINNFDAISRFVDKLEELDLHANKFTFIIKYVRNELLGKGRVKMEDQCRGTRNIINEFLLMPANKEIFCSQDSIDFDSILKNGDITVFNYNLASGDTDAIALGLVFLLSFNNAVLSRPGNENTRSPHFFYIDEFPVLIHPSLEKNFSLFRKFRVAMFVAIQTMDQFEKNALTKYLKGVILGCAHIIVFGRSSLKDMEIFSKFAGIQDQIDSQTTISQTSLTDSDTKLSYSSRDTITQKNVVEEIDIRMKDFQEVTLFTEIDGRPLPPIHGRVDFLKKADWHPQKRATISFLSTKTNETAGVCIKELSKTKNASYRSQPASITEGLNLKLNASIKSENKEIVPISSNINNNIEKNIETGPIISDPEPEFEPKSAKDDENIEDLF